MPGAAPPAGGDPTGMTSMGAQVLGSVATEENKKAGETANSIRDATSATNQKETTAPIADGMVGTGSQTVGADAKRR